MSRAAQTPGRLDDLCPVMLIADCLGQWEYFERGLGLQLERPQAEEVLVALRLAGQRREIEGCPDQPTRQLLFFSHRYDPAEDIGLSFRRLSPLWRIGPAVV